MALRLACLNPAEARTWERAALDSVRASLENDLADDRLVYILVTEWPENESFRPLVNRLVAENLTKKTENWIRRVQALFLPEDPRYAQLQQYFDRVALHQRGAAKRNWRNSSRKVFGNVQDFRAFFNRDRAWASCPPWVQASLLKKWAPAVLGDAKAPQVVKEFGAVVRTFARLHPDQALAVGLDQRLNQLLDSSQKPGDRITGHLSELARKDPSNRLLPDLSELRQGLNATLGGRRADILARWEERLVRVKKVPTSAQWSELDDEFRGTWLAEPESKMPWLQESIQAVRAALTDSSARLENAELEATLGNLEPLRGEPLMAYLEATEHYGISRYAARVIAAARAQTTLDVVGVHKVASRVKTREIDRQKQGKVLPLIEQIQEAKGIVAGYAAELQAHAVRATGARSITTALLSMFGGWVAAATIWLAAPAIGMNPLSAQHWAIGLAVFWTMYFAVQIWRLCGIVRANNLAWDEDVGNFRWLNDVGKGLNQDLIW